MSKSSNIRRTDPRARHPELHDAPEGIAPESAHLSLLASLVDLVKPDAVLELGTGNGHSAAAIGRALAKNGVGGLLTVECNTRRASQAARLVRGLPVRVFLGDYRGPQFAAELSGSPRFDLVHIDADWEHRVREVELVQHHLAPDAVLVLHDMGAASPGQHAIGALWNEWNVVRFLTPRGTVLLQRREAVE